MARVIVSSSALHTQLGAHLGAATVQMRVAGGMCSLWSEEYTNTLPCETQWKGTATVGLEALLAALAKVPDQPISLDLHEQLAGKLYAQDRNREPLLFDLPRE